MLLLQVLAGLVGWLAGGACMGKGVGGHFPTKTKQMWLETPAAQGPAQGPRKVQGSPGRQGGIVDKIPAAGSPWLLTDQLAALLLNHRLFFVVLLFCIAYWFLAYNGLLLAPLKEEHECGSRLAGHVLEPPSQRVMPNDCKINGI